MELGNTKPEVVRSTNRSQGKDLNKEGAEAKKGNYLIGYSLKPS